MLLWVGSFFGNDTECEKSGKLKKKKKTLQFVTALMQVTTDHRP